MYAPPYNRMEDREELLAFMRANSFCLLVTGVDGELGGSHLPAIVDERDDGIVLLMHMARSNAQWQSFFDDDVMAVFFGPHAYVSPRWYEQSERVPTWNYAAVHAYGRPQVIDARDAKHAAMRRLVEAHDGEWLERFDALSAQYLEGMLTGIVVFEIAVTRLDARWKLSQNRGRREQELIAARLDRSADSDERALATLMRSHLAAD